VEPHLEQGMIKMDSFIISAFCTAETSYEMILATQLLPSLDKLGLKYHIEVVENQGSWLKNVAQKPLTILHTMEKYPSYNIVSLDADSEVLSYPKLFNEIPEDVDIAFHTLNWDFWYKNNSHVMEVLSGTIFIRNNEKMGEFVKEWYLRAETVCEWEQKVLAKLLEERKECIKVFPLPLEYCYISSLPDGKEPHIKCDNVVIKHNQASRYLKKKIIK
jgi:hypothetical protein